MHENGSMHMHTLLNLAAVCGCLVLLDDLSVGESSLLLERSFFFLFFFLKSKTEGWKHGPFLFFCSPANFFSVMLSYVHLKYFYLICIKHVEPQIVFTILYQSSF